MGRIGSFFKKVWGGIKKVGKKIISIAPKVIDTGKKIVQGVQPVLGALPQNKFTEGVGKAVSFGDKALDKADQLVKAQQQGGVQGLLKAGAGMIPRR